MATIQQLADVGKLREGDILFQSSRSSQSQAIQLATHSTFSHCGILVRKGGQYFVYEAIQPVKFTPLKQWIGRGEGGRYAIRRVRNADSVLTEKALKKMKTYAAQQTGKNYDLAFSWTDERMYCSELVWKLYRNATGLQLGRLQKLNEFDLTAEPVRKKLQERYGANIPYDEPVISPARLYESDLLVTVTSNY